MIARHVIACQLFRRVIKLISRGCTYIHTHTHTRADKMYEAMKRYTRSQKKGLRPIRWTLQWSFPFIWYNSSSGGDSVKQTHVMSSERSVDKVTTMPSAAGLTRATAVDGIQLRGRHEIFMNYRRVSRKPNTARIEFYRGKTK